MDCFTDFVYEIIPRSLARFLGAVFDFVYMPSKASAVFVSYTDTLQYSNTQ
jgi:hypothetical protein